MIVVCTTEYNSDSQYQSPLTLVVQQNYQGTQERCGMAGQSRTHPTNLPLSCRLADYQANENLCKRN